MHHRKIFGALACYLYSLPLLANIAPPPQVQPNSVPEPATLLLLGVGAAGMLLAARRKR